MYIGAPAHLSTTSNTIRVLENNPKLRDSAQYTPYQTSQLNAQNSGLVGVLRFYQIVASPDVFRAHSTAHGQHFGPNNEKSHNNENNGSRNDEERQQETPQDSKENKPKIPLSRQTVQNLRVICTCFRMPVMSIPGSMTAAFITS